MQAVKILQRAAVLQRCSTAAAKQFLQPTASITTNRVEAPKKKDEEVELKSFCENWKINFQLFLESEVST